VCHVTCLTVNKQSYKNYNCDTHTASSVNYYSSDTCCTFACRTKQNETKLAKQATAEAFSKMNALHWSKHGCMQN